MKDMKDELLARGPSRTLRRTYTRFSSRNMAKCPAFTRFRHLDEIWLILNSDPSSTGCFDSGVVPRRAQHDAVAAWMRRGMDTPRTPTR
jgi:hypothetical protein